MEDSFGRVNDVSGTLGVGIYYSFIGEFEKGDSYLNDSLEGGGSETLINDAQGKTFGQAILMMKIDF